MLIYLCNVELDFGWVLYVWGVLGVKVVVLVVDLLVWLLLGVVLVDVDGVY